MIFLNRRRILSPQAFGSFFFPLLGTYIYGCEFVEIFEFVDWVLGLLLDELDKGLCRPLSAILPLSHDAVANVLQGGVLCDVETSAQITCGRGRKKERKRHEKLDGFFTGKHFSRKEEKK